MRLYSKHNSIWYYSFVFVLSIFFFGNTTLKAACTTDFDALMALYNATDGANWTDNTNWGVGDPCTNNWYGVGCNGSGEVVNLYLNNNNLVGNIPPEIGCFTALRQLRLNDNVLTGGIPSEIGDLSNLIQLYLQNNTNLGGSIPPEIGNLTSMGIMFIDHCGLTGSIPIEIGNLTIMTQLKLQYNNLTGPIPNEISNITSLTILLLNNNHLSGLLPPDLGNIAPINYLFINDNMLEGCYPEGYSAFCGMGSNNLRLNHNSDLPGAGSYFTFNKIFCEQGENPASFLLMPDFEICSTDGTDYDLTDEENFLWPLLFAGLGVTIDVEWYDGDPGNGGTEFPDPEHADISTVPTDGLWVNLVDISDDDNCEYRFRVDFINNISPTIIDPVITACHDNATAYDLTQHNSTVNNNSGLAVIWYEGEPDNGGTVISPDTNVDLTLLNSLWVKINDGNCTNTIEISLTVFPQPMATCSVLSHESCDGDANGSAQVIPDNGLSPYSYLWSTGGTSDTENNLSVGSHSVTITDANLCTNSCMITINPGVDIMIIQNIQSTCNDNGTPSDPSDDWFTITVNASASNGGTNYELVLDADPDGNNGTILSTEVYGTSITFGSSMPHTFLADGISSYNLTIRDANNPTCYEIFITIPVASCSNLCDLIANASATDETGNDLNDGTATCNPTSSNPPFSYTWSNGATTQSISNLSPANYTVTVTDDSGCTSIETVTVNAYDCQALSINASITDITCFGDCDGEVNINEVLNAEIPLSFIWSNGETTDNIDGLCEGIYSVTITDNNNCTTFGSYTITQPNELIANASSTDETGNDLNDGTATCNPTGGDLPYTYTWSNGATTQSISNLSPGNYSVTVTDDSGCTSIETVTVAEYNCPVLAIVISQTNATCFGDCDGILTVDNLTNAQTPFSYIWSNGATTQTINNLCADNYSVTVTDDNNCSVSNNYFIIQPDELYANTNSTGETDLNANDGTATSNPNGGNIPYTYLWSNGQTIQSITNLNPGNYTVTVTDDNGCTAIETTIVTAFNCPDLSIVITQENNTCYNACNGQLTINSITNGIAPYIYNWSNGETTDKITNLCEGNYNVTVTDDDNCSVIESFVITQPDILTPNTSSTNETNIGDNDGTATTNPIGGTSPYTFIWNTGETTQSIINLSPGNYAVTITDDNGCIAEDTVIISGDEFQCEISATVSNVFCNDNGTADKNDDTYSFELIVSGSNTGNNWTANDPNNTSGTYDITKTFGPYDIVDGNISFTIKDEDNSNCIYLVEIIPPEPCSNSCNIVASPTSPICDDSGTASDPNDDIYYFDMIVSGSNMGTNWTANDPNNTSGTYDITKTFGPFGITSGEISFDITDNNNSSCKTTVNIIPPSTCSDLCDISNTVYNIFCNDNGTDSNPNDDTFTFDVNVNGSNTGNNWTANDPNNTSGTYDITKTFGPYDIGDEELLSFSIKDENNNCSTDVNVIVPNPCSDEKCVINASTSNIICDNNGTPIDPSDDTFVFEINVTGTNTGMSWTTDSGEIGEYDKQVIFGPYPISEGSFFTTIIDDDEESCKTTILISPPNTCEESATKISYANIFSSDPNSENNGFTIYSNDDNLIILNLSIYNRWGSQIFYTKNIKANQQELGWNGTFRNQPVSSGVYIFFAKVIDSNGKIHTFTGDITVIR